MLVRVQLTGRSIRQSPRAAHRLVQSGVGKITDAESLTVYEKWLESQKPASTVPAPEKPQKAVKRTRRADNAS